MPRLPFPGQDAGAWGIILNDYLSVEHNADGTLKKASDITVAKTTADQAQTTADQALTAANVAYTKPGTGIPATDLASSVQTSLTKADTALQVAPVTSVVGQTGAITGSHILADTTVASALASKLDASAGAVTTASLANGAVTAAKVAADVATQAELDAAVAGLGVTYAPLGPDTGQVSVADRNTAALRYFRHSLALRNIQRCDIAVVPGDSLTEGQGTTAITNRWTDRLRDILRSRFPTTGVTGGYGYIACRSIVSGSTYPFVTLAGTPTPPGAQYGFGRRAAQVQNATQTITLNAIASTEIDLHYTNGGGGTFAWAVDGGATTNVVTTGATGPQKVRVLTGGGGTNHSVVVSWVSGNNIINGFDVFNGDATKGVRVHNGGFNGAKAADWVPLHSGQNYWADQLSSSLLNPSLVLVPIGANEFKTGDSVATYQSNLTAIILSIRTYAPLASICLVVEHELGGVTVVNPWAQYVAANYAVAAADGNVAVLDLWQRVGSTPAAETHGLILSSDHQHYTDEGNVFVAETVAAFIAPGVAAAVTPTVLAADTAFVGSYAPLGGSLRTAVGWGDSITQGGVGNSYYDTLVFSTGGRLLSRKNAGAAGERSGAILARFAADVAPYCDSSTVVFIRMGTNDLGDSGYTRAISVANLDSAIALVRSKGATPIVLSLPPKSTNRDKVAAYNRAYANLCQRRNVRFVNDHSSVVDPATGSYRSGMSDDGTHPNGAAIKLMVAAILPQINDLLGGSPVLCSDNADSTNLLANGLFLTDTNADGVADSWSPIATIASPVRSIVTGDTSILGSWQQLSMTANNGYSMLQQTTATGFTVGDTVRLSCRATTSGLTNQAVWRIGYIVGAGNSYQWVVQDSAVIIDGAVIERDFVVPIGTTNLGFAMQLKTTSTGNSDGVLKISQAGLYNQTTLGGLS